MFQLDARAAAGASAASRGTARARQGAARERQAQCRPRHAARRQGLHVEAAVRHRPDDGAGARRHGRGRPGDDREQQGALELRHHHGAHRRARRRDRDQGRQQHQVERRAARHDQPGEADLRRIQPAPGRAAGAARGDDERQGRRSAPSPRAIPARRLRAMSNSSTTRSTRHPARSACARPSPTTTNGCGRGSSSTFPVTTRTDPNAIVVPPAAVQIGQDGDYVFVVKPDNTAEIRPVKVSRTVDGKTVVAKGLARRRPRRDGRADAALERRRASTSVPP